MSSVRSFSRGLCACLFLAIGLQFGSDTNNQKIFAHAAGAKSGSNVSVLVDKQRQELSVRLDGTELYRWPISTGAHGYSTPAGSFRPVRLEPDHYSKEYDGAPMPHSIFFTLRGHAIHGSFDTERLGRPASRGCVRLAPENAAKLYALVETAGLYTTDIEIRGIEPGESVSATSGQEPRLH